MEKQVRFSLKLVIAALFVLAALGAVSMVPAVAGASFALAPGGTPMYAWGVNNNGQLGQGDSGPDTQRLTPIRVGDAENWVQVSSGAGGAAALNAEGHLYAWGAAWTSPQMGQGDNPANPGTGLITVPTRVGDRDNWTYVLVMNTNVTAINDQGHLYTWGVNGNGQLGLGDTDPRDVPTRVGTASNWAMARTLSVVSVALNDQGHLYTWGSNSQGQLGQGTIGGSLQLTPQRVGTNDNWVFVGSFGASAAMAINDQGHLYTWGNNNNGQLGHGDTDNRDVPTRVGTASNWVEAIGTNHGSMIALNSNDQVYTWGNDDYGALGRVVDAANPANLPGRIEGNNWIAIGAGNSHVLAMAEGMRLYTWGNNNNGQLGIGTIGGYEEAPQFALQAFGLAGFTQSSAGHVSMALIRTQPAVPEPGEADIVKHLEKPEGTNLLAPITFTFEFERHSFNNNTALASQLPNIPNRTITLSHLSYTTTAGGITTSVGITDALEGIEFIGTGIYSWIVREAPTTGVSAPSSLVDSQAVYEFRVYVSQEEGVGGSFYIYAITVYRIYDDAGVALATPQKVDDFVFTNTYTRTTTGDNGGLVVSKNVTGPFADTSTVFNFEVTLTRTAMCAEGANFTGQVFNADGTPSGSALSFTSGTATPVNLTHGQRLVVDNFMVGTQFAVTELAAPDFVASVNLLVNGATISVPANTAPNQALSTGTHFAGSAENSAAFTNDHRYAPPTGIVAGNAPVAFLVVAAIGAALLLVSKHRKRIEELPLTQ